MELIDGGKEEQILAPSVKVRIISVLVGISLTLSVSVGVIFLAGILDEKDTVSNHKRGSADFLGLPSHVNIDGKTGAREGGSATSLLVIIDANTPLRDILNNYTPHVFDIHWINLNRSQQNEGPSHPDDDLEWGLDALCSRILSSTEPRFLRYSRYILVGSDVYVNMPRLEAQIIASYQALDRSPEETPSVKFTCGDKCTNHSRAMTFILNRRDLLKSCKALKSVQQLPDIQERNISQCEPLHASCSGITWSSYYDAINDSGIFRGPLDPAQIYQLGISRISSDITRLSGDGSDKNHVTSCRNVTSRQVIPSSSRDWTTVKAISHSYSKDMEAPYSFTVNKPGRGLDHVTIAKVPTPTSDVSDYDIRTYMKRRSRGYHGDRVQSVRITQTVNFRTYRNIAVLSRNISVTSRNITEMT